jgi:hypothetical protein
MRIAQGASSNVENFSKGADFVAGDGRRSAKPERRYKSSRQHIDGRGKITGFSLAKGISAPQKLPLP